MSTIERPKTLDGFFSVWRPGAEMFAGSTDWVIKRRGELTEDAVVVDLSLIEELKGIKLEKGMLHIGAAETMTALHESAVVRRYAAALADAAYVMGSEQIRNRATVGGNVANSSPAADTPSPFAALGASVVAVSARGERRLSIEEVVGRDENRLLDGEIIKEFIIPADEGRISAFLKIGSRSQVSISRINIAVSARPEDGVYKDARVYVGTLGSAAKKCEEAEAALAQPRCEEPLQEALCAFASRMIPGRATLPYKQSALRALALDICAALGRRAGGVKK